MDFLWIYGGAPITEPLKRCTGNVQVKVLIRLIPVFVGCLFLEWKQDTYSLWIFWIKDSGNNISLLSDET